MPWKVLARLVTWLVLGRVIARRSRSGAAAGTDRDLRRRLTGARRLAAVVGRTLALGITLGMAAVIMTAAVSVLTLGPRWLGVLTALIGVTALVATALQARSLWLAVRAWRRRRSAEVLRRSL